MDNFMCINFLKVKNIKENLVRSMKRALNQNGMGTVEIIIIIAVLVALALLFKTFILDLSEGIFDKIKTKTNTAIDSL